MNNEYLSKPIIGIIILIAVSVAAVLHVHTARARNVWGKMGLQITGQADFKITGLYEEKTDDADKMELSGSLDGRYLRITANRNMNREKNEDYVAVECMRLDSLFQKKILPYPGTVSYTSEPASPLLPSEGILEIEQKPVKYYLFYADEEFRPCVYEMGAIRYRILMFYLYNDKRGYSYKVEYYFPGDGANVEAEIAKLKGIKYRS